MVSSEPPLLCRITTNEDDADIPSEAIRITCPSVSAPAMEEDKDASVSTPATKEDKLKTLDGVRNLSAKMP